MTGFGKSIVLDPVQPTTRADRYPTQAVIITNAARRLIELSKGGERIESVVVQGEQDPTLHPEFVEISENLRDLVRKWFPKAQLALNCEAPRLDDPLVRHALLAYHSVVIRFEWSTQKTYKGMTGGDPADFKSLVDHIGSLDHRNLVIKSTFVRGTHDNSTVNEVRGWSRILGAVKPALVRLETPARQKDGVKPVTKTRMNEIAEIVTETIGAQVEQI